MASLLPALPYERELVAIKYELQSLGHHLINAKQRLAALVNSSPDQRFRLVVGANTDRNSCLFKGNWVS